MSYFIGVGDCKKCGWPHHRRTEFGARKARRWPWQREARPAGHYDECCNCSMRTYHYDETPTQTQSGSN